MAEQQVSTNKFGISDWIVDGGGIAKGATHTTIAAAFSSASSGDTIYIRPGTYAGNLTIPVGINVTSLPGNNAQGNVNIVGKLTQTATGTSTFANLQFTTNFDVILDIGGSGSIQTAFQRCSFFLVDGDGITINNASASPNFTDCSFHQTGNTLDYFNITACSTTTFAGCRFFSTGTIGTSDVDAGTVSFVNCNLHQLLTCSGAALYRFKRCSWNPNQNVTFLTTAGTGTSTIQDLTLVSGTAAAISIGSGTTVEAQLLSIHSTNTDPIEGAGTIVYGEVEFSDTGHGISTTTTTPGTVVTGSISFDDGTNSLDEYEEGSWTPTIDASSSSPSITYSERVGAYTRIGNQVVVTCSLNWSANSGGTGNFELTGLPFTSANTVLRAMGGFLSNEVTFDAGAIYIIPAIIPNTSLIRCFQVRDNTNFIDIPIADIGTGNFQLQIQYAV